MHDPESPFLLLEPLSIDLLFGPPEQEQHLTGLLRQVGGDFRQLWISTPSAIPPQMEIQFRVRIGSILLASGRGELMPGGSGEESVLTASPDHPVEVWARAVRLAPFLAETERRRLLTSMVPRARSENAWQSWVEAAIRLSRLVEVSGRINSSQGLEDLLSEIMESAKLIMDAEASSLMLLDRDTGELVIAVPTGPAMAEISGLRIPPGKGIGGWVARTGAPLIVSQAEHDPRFFGDVARTGFRTRNMICVPLRNGERQVIGVLQALNRKGSLTFNDDDIPVFLALSDHAAIAIEKAKLHREALEKQRLEREISLAQAIQSGFFPKSWPELPGIEVAGLSEPASQVGGDYFDVIELGGDRCALVVADISGKGFSAALLMASLRAALRAQVHNRLKVEETISMVNSAFVEDSPANRFVTLFYGEVDCRIHRFRFVNAGHNPPFFLRHNDQSLHQLEEGGPILGFMKGLPFVPGEVELEVGDTILMYTDGVVEAQNQAGEMFGDDRLKEILLAAADEGAGRLIARVHDAVDKFVNGAPQYDDLTLLVLRRTE